MGAGLQAGELIGRKLGEFEVLELIGQGSFGMVFRAEQGLLQREAVVKVARFPGTDAVANRAVAKFLAEARLASRIDHPFAAHIYAFGAEPDGLLWIAMEFVRGTPLDRLLQSQGAMPLERAVPLIRRLCEVVHQAHEQGIVHRDLKPANVMVVARGGTLFPKLLDLGIARDIHATSAPDERGALMGTPMYMAPEQWVNAKSVTAAADIYALGALTYEVLTGAPIFAGDSVHAIAAQHALTAAPSLPSEFPAELSMAVERALAKKAADRFPTALAFSEAMLATSGIAADSFNLPALDELTRDEVLIHGPQPIAEAVSAFEAARTPLLARAALWQTARVMAKYVGLVALACRSRTGSGRLGDAPAVLECLAALRKKSLDTTQWWRLARELCRPFAAMPEVHPIPELVGLFFEGRAELKTPMDLLLESRAREPGAEATPEELRGFLVGAVPALGSSLRALRFLHEYKLVVPHDGRDELWMGVRRPVRTATQVVRPRSLTASIAASSVAGLAAMRATMGTLNDQVVAVDFGGEAAPKMGPVTAQISAMAGPLGNVGAASQPLLIGTGGVAVVSLWPLIQVEPPSPGYPLELFMLDGQGRHGARLLSVSDRLERSDEAVWPRLGLGSIDAELTGSLADDDAPPYRGLATFTEADAGMFFGREREVEGFVNRLATMPLIAVVGPSGAGKSSFVQAGVLPTLGPDWTSMVVRPGPAPFDALCARLAQRGVAVTSAQLRADPGALGAVLRRYADATGTSLLLVVDQFEELVTLCLDEVEQAAYASALVQVATDDAPVRVVITMRDDFMVRVAQLPALRHRLATSLQILTTPVTADLLRILTEPARRAGYGFEDEALPQEMVAEVANQPAALALLSFTAYQLWQYRDRHFKQLPRKAYRALGGVGGALAQHAEATLDGMDAPSQMVVREVFRHLVTAEGTRAVLSRAELLQVAGGEAAGSAIEGLIQARLLVAMDRGGGESIEVVHEALLSAWPRLVQWRQEDAESARLRDQLRVAARQWAERGRSRGLLWRGEALAEYTLWRKRYPGALTTIEEDFGRASVADAARGRRLRRGALIVVGAGLVIALVVFAGLRSQAEAARVTAEQNRREAVASKTLAAAQLTESYEEQGRRALLAGDAPTALLYLNEAMQRGQDTPALRFMIARGLQALGTGVETLAGHRGAVWDARYAPDGKRLASISADGDARIWDVASGRTLRTLAGHAPSGAPQVAWTPDGARLVTGDGAGIVRIWNTTTGALERKLDAHAGMVVEVYVDPTGATILSSGSDGVTSVWDLATGARRATLPSPGEGNMARAIFAPRSDRVLVVYTTGWSPGWARLWTPATGAIVDLKGHNDTVWFPRFDPQGTRLATCSADRTVRIWDVATGKLLRVLGGHDETVGDVAWSPDGTMLASGSSDHTIKIWDAATGAIRFGLRGHTAKINRLTFTASGELISIAADGTARGWDVQRGALVATYAHGGFLYQLSVRPDDAQLATGSLAGTIKLWSLAERDLTRTLTGTQGEVYAAPQYGPGRATALRVGDAGVEQWDVRTGVRTVLPTPRIGLPLALAADGGTLAVADMKGNVQLFDAARQPLRTIAAANVGLWSIALNASGTELFTVVRNGAIARWEVATGARLAARDGETVGDVYPSPTGDVLLATVQDPTGGFGIVWQLDPRTLARQRQMAETVVQVIWSPAGDAVAFVRTQPAIEVWTADHGALVGKRDLDQGGVPFAVAWTHTGDRLVAGLSDGVLNIWAPRDGTRVHRLAAHELWIAAVDLSANDHFVVTTGADATVRTWDLATGRQLGGFVGAPGIAEARVVAGGDATVTISGPVIDVWRSGTFAGTPAALSQTLACRLEVKLAAGSVVEAPRPTECP